MTPFTDLPKYTKPAPHMDIRAYHAPTKSWRWACMGNDNAYVRLDPHANEHLHDFSVYEVTIVEQTADNERFTIKRSLNHLPRVLS